LESEWICPPAVQPSGKLQGGWQQQPALIL
jgi:hypothetical protein